MQSQIEFLTDLKFLLLNKADAIHISKLIDDRITEIKNIHEAAMNIPFIDPKWIDKKNKLVHAMDFYGGYPPTYLLTNCGVLTGRALLDDDENKMQLTNSTSGLEEYKFCERCFKQR